MTSTNIQYLVTCAIFLVLSACANDNSSARGESLPEETTAINCAVNNCQSLSIVGDEPAMNVSNFRGYADPGLAEDPDVPGRLWLTYSWLDLADGTSVSGEDVQIAVVSNHLARSDDGGETFSFVSDLWPAIPMFDPEAFDGNGILNSETGSLVAIKDNDNNVMWYGAHLRYFQKPETGYHPKYATSWTVRVTAAPTPEGLSTAPEAVLGVSQTAGEYAPDVAIDQLAGLSLLDCSMINNPSLFTQNQTLYLIVECLAFTGPSLELDFSKVSMQVFATTPVGEPSTWWWQHVGKITDASLASELGSETLQQPDVAYSADGVPLLIVTLAHGDASTVVGTVHDGCIVLELESIDPPVIARDIDGDVKVRAKMVNSDLGACTFNANSASGILAHEQPAEGINRWSIIATGFRL